VVEGLAEATAVPAQEAGHVDDLLAVVRPVDDFEGGAADLTFELLSPGPGRLGRVGGAVVVADSPTLTERCVGRR
jgi:hypothetical protein